MEYTGLAIEDIELIREVFSRHENIEKVLIYGSRAMGNYKPASDIDLTLIGSHIDLGLQNEIELELDDLMLPYKFDISVYDKITNSEFLELIQKEGKEFYERSQHESILKK